jgi:hypothetical protein
MEYVGITKILRTFQEVEIYFWIFNANFIKYLFFFVINEREVQFQFHHLEAKFGFSEK